MASVKALCRIHINSFPSHNDKAENASASDAACSLPNNDDTHKANPQTRDSSAEASDLSTIPLELRLRWANAIADKFCDRPALDRHTDIRDWDIGLNSDGSVENAAEDLLPSQLPLSPSLDEKHSPIRQYPARYRLPDQVRDRLHSDEEKAIRAELFALGSLLYRLMSGAEVFSDLEDDEDESEDEKIQDRFAKGEFPGDVWGLPIAVRILGCWCRGFARDVLDSRTSANLEHAKPIHPTPTASFLDRTGSYIEAHPILFSLQVLGGAASVASVATLPVLGAVGFAATGPVGGSAAAAWQAGLGIVKAGSLFSWCQSAAMGGAAVGGIVATGVAGATVAAGAGIVGVLDIAVGKDEVPLLRERFLEAWRSEVGIEEESHL